MVCHLWNITHARNICGATTTVYLCRARHGNAPSLDVVCGTHNIFRSIMFVHCTAQVSRILVHQLRRGIGVFGWPPSRHRAPEISTAWEHGALAPTEDDTEKPMEHMRVPAASATSQMHTHMYHTCTWRRIRAAGGRRISDTIRCSCAALTQATFRTFYTQTESERTSRESKAQHNAKGTALRTIRAA